MTIETWVINQSINGNGTIVFRLTAAQSRIPDSSYICGNAPDPLSPPPGKFPVGIRWPDGHRTEHFVREDSNRNMITDRTDAAKSHYAPFIKTAGQTVAITAIKDGEFVVSIVEN